MQKIILLRYLSSLSGLGIREIISYVSQYFSLEKGDIILTGTPEGVGKLKDGDKLTASIEALGTMNFSVTKAGY